MNILSTWLREYLPALEVDDRQLAEDLTLRGIAVEGVHELASGGHLFEMDITTNRVDAMNHYGIAREAAAIYGVPLLTLEDRRVIHAETGDAVSAELPSLACDVPAPAGEDAGAFPVRIEAEDLCGRFTAQVIRGVAVSQSTGVIAERFAQLGQKPISNAVDVTNCTWLAMGHPTHVFDLDTLEGGIVVRRARAGERIKLLDGSEKVLTVDDLVIADEKKALSLAGVMGGWDSRVTEATKNILVEAAWFDPAAIRASSRRHGLHTDASHRYERGADLGACALADRLVTRGVIAACGGEAVGVMTDVSVPEKEARTTDRAHVLLSIDEVQRLLGTTLEESTSGRLVPPEMIEQYLQALGCHLRPSDEPGSYQVTLPSWRLDLEREIDLIEEIARVYGYNRFADTLPSFSGGVVELPHAAPEAKVRNTLLALGWTEAISSTFCSEGDAATFAAPGEAGVAMGNPLSAEAGMLRPSLLPGMVGMLQLNSTRDVPSVRLFEYGNVFTGTTEQVSERASVVLGAYGGAAASKLVPSNDALFFELKGALEEVLSRFAISRVTFAADNLPAWIQPGRGARVTLGDTTLGWFGELSAEERERRKLKEAAVVAELLLPHLFEHALRQPLAQDPSRFQAVERDLSFLFPDAVRWSQVESALRGLAIPEMLSVAPIEIYRDPKGKSVAQGEYSLLLRMIFQSAERTLRDEELTAWQDAAIHALTGIGGKHRFMAAP
ncbi:MAG: phenylalanine--tRNA ligase subunit beta [Janthinobacterium lividum]